EHASRVFSSEPGTSAPPFTGGGYARIFGPDSTLLSDVLPPEQEGIVYADIDLIAIEIANHYFDPVGHYSRPDIFEVTIDRRPKPADHQITSQPPRSDPPLAPEDTHHDSPPPQGEVTRTPPHHPAPTPGHLALRSSPPNSATAHRTLTP